jgi:glycosyltransferase involved in cell wall biosynthesis
MYTVSVIIPNFNRVNLIGATIQNMLQQTLPPHEVIVVDDGSTDESVKVIQSFGDRITLIQQPNRGPGAARNAGLTIATGEFIQFMDSDDLVSLNKLEVQAETLTEQNADIAYGPWAKTWMANHQLQLQDVVLQQKPLPCNRPPLHWFLTAWSMVFQQCLIRKSFLDQVGNYREDMQLYEDGELFVRMLLAGAKLVHESETLTLYRLEDHAKLTNTGSHGSQKIIDKAHFYALAIEQISKQLEDKALLKHIEFRQNAWQALTELKKIQAPESGWIRQLETATSNGTAFFMYLRRWLNQKERGLQHRCKGHRWHYSYQPAPMTLQQKYLVEHLGFCLI